MANYGRLLIENECSYENKCEAVEYIKKAVDGGNKDAMLVFAKMLEEGDGVPVNKEEAKKYYKLAEQKDGMSILINGRCFTKK